MSERNTPERIWLIVGRLGFPLALAALLAGLGVWRGQAVVEVELTHHDSRLQVLEQSDLAIQVAQASEKLKKIDEAAAIANENRRTIDRIEVRQESIERRVDETREDVKEILRRLPLNPAPRITPAAPPASVAEPVV